MELLNNLKPTTPKILIATKSDIEQTLVEYVQIYRASKKYNVDYIKCSAKTGDNVEDTFIQAFQVGYIQKYKKAATNDAHSM